MDGSKRPDVAEILPKSGLVYSEKGGFAEILCKPKILPLKSAVLEQLQRIDQAVEDQAQGSASSLNMQTSNTSAAFRK